VAFDVNSALFSFICRVYIFGYLTGFDLLGLCALGILIVGRHFVCTMEIQLRYAHFPGIDIMVYPVRNLLATGAGNSCIISTYLAGAIAVSRSRPHP
jgi:hypothetical protein